MKSITPFDKKSNSELRDTVSIETLAKRRKRKKALLWQGKQLQDLSLFRLVRVNEGADNE